MSQVLVESKYIKVVDPKTDITGLKLLKVTMKCACCKKDFHSFEVMSDRLSEWQKMAKDGMQPLCNSCAKAHKKWHTEQEKLDDFKLWLENEVKNPTLKYPGYRDTLGLVLDRFSSVVLKKKEET